MAYLVTLKMGQVLVSDLTCQALQRAVSVQFPDVSVRQCSDAELTKHTDILLENASVSWNQSIETITAAPVGSDVGSSPSDSLDYSQLSAVWTIAFCSVVGFYILSLKIALVLSVVRRA